MPVPKMRNFSEASQYDPKEMLGQIEQTMRDKNAFFAHPKQWINRKSMIGVIFYNIFPKRKK